MEAGIETGSFWSPFFWPLRLRAAQREGFSLCPACPVDLPGPALGQNNRAALSAATCPFPTAAHRYKPIAGLRPWRVRAVKSRGLRRLGARQSGTGAEGRGLAVLGEVVRGADCAADDLRRKPAALQESNLLGLFGGIGRCGAEFLSPHFARTIEFAIATREGVRSSLIAREGVRSSLIASALLSCPACPVLFA